MSYVLYFAFIFIFYFPLFYIIFLSSFNILQWKHKIYIFTLLCNFEIFLSYSQSQHKIHSLQSKALACHSLQQWSPRLFVHFTFKII